MYLMTPESGAVYEYGDADSMGAQARALGIGPVELYLDALDASDGAAIVNWPVLNEDFDAIGGAARRPGDDHGPRRCRRPRHADHGRQPADVLPLALGPRPRHARRSRTASAGSPPTPPGFVGYRDRGVLRAGAYADVNVIDLDGMWLPIPEIVDDFPAARPGSSSAHAGIDHTIVNGEPFLDHGEHTGALAGRLLRSTD